MRLRRNALVLAVAALIHAGGAAAAGRALAPQVAGLQVALAATRFYAGAIDAVPGTATVSAVRSLQRQKGLPVNGLATPATRAALGPLGRPLFGTRVIRHGMVGWDVSVLQFLLAVNGLDVGTLDGRYGPRTLAALVAYQRRAGLAPDGVVGPATRARICPTSGCRSLPWPRERSRTRYRVRAGDTLTTIAARSGTTVAALARANGIDPESTLSVGARLRLPARRLEATWPVESVPAGVVKATVRRFAARAGVSPGLALAVARVESGYRSDLRSSTGDWGPMQVSAPAWDFVESVVVERSVPHTTRGNIRVGILYLRRLLDDFRGDERLAVGAYHQGAASVREHGLFPETARYVAAVQAIERHGS